MPRAPRPRRLTVTRWYDSSGRQVRAGTPGARKVRELTSTYYVTLGGTRHALETDDEAEAWRRMREIQDRLAAGAAPKPAAGRVGGVAELVEDYCALIAGNGTGAAQVGLVRARLLHLAEAAGWRTAYDLTDESLAAGLARLARERQLSAQTRNHYRSHARALGLYLSERSGRVVFTRRVKALPVRPGRELVHRCPTAGELAALLAALDGGPVANESGAPWSRPPWRVRCGLTSRARAMGYRVCLGAGLRADELRSLTRASFDLDAGTLQLAAADEKNRRGNALPLPPALALQLRDHFAQGGPTWGRFPAQHPGRVLRDDLAEAGVEYETPDGCFTFHSFRVWYLTQLASQPGIDPKTLQTLARHSTAALTLDVYAKAQGERLRAAAGQLPTP